MDEELMGLYRNIEMEADSSILNYFTQIELAVSSEREWQIIQLIAQLDWIPLPYFISYKRFYNYIKNTTTWNLKPVLDKLVNTECYFDVARYKDKFRNIRAYKKLDEM